MIWKSFKKRLREKKLLPRLAFLSYALMAIGVVFLGYALVCDKVPTEHTLLSPDWAIFSGHSLSQDLDHFTLTDKEVAQIYLVAPLFMALGGLLKFIGARKR